jgi:hypothetical protein
MENEKKEGALDIGRRDFLRLASTGLMMCAAAAMLI